MEELVAIIAKEGLVSGAFIYMLYHFLSKFTVTQQEIANSVLRVSQDQQGIATSLDSVSKEMSNISQEMSKLNERVDKLENEK